MYIFLLKLDSEICGSVPDIECLQSPESNECKLFGKHGRKSWGFTAELPHRWLHVSCRLAWSVCTVLKMCKPNCRFKIRQFLHKTKRTPSLKKKKLSKFWGPDHAPICNPHTALPVVTSGQASPPSLLHRGPLSSGPCVWTVVPSSSRHGPCVCV